MKSALSVFLLLLCPACCSLLRAQSTPVPKAAASFSVQKTVVYPVRDPARLPVAIAWYTAFFGKQPARVEQALPYPRAVYQIDGVEVRLETDPRFLQLKEPVFYWMLPTPKDVESKFNALHTDPANRFEGGLFRKVRRIEDSPTDKTLSRAAPGAVNQVSGFIAIDPEGNQVGVINNPVYPPKIDEQ
ncbi:hypothetical protein [Hymenobacter psychrotolerans]|uniref:Glyoxalase-like domain-containing protein n=1 Tax=Hymenobacter psychrotolerans DSM 18569 TaxID=1121959 RepID=A0A1M7BXM3_9BACT|nr:hypothetical protein [Hymenobacter psychrotolerans]SHL59762.1 hypothetical protein SAMN02746009_03043 [Hymenobacter psychrotolerans DSM 18569]